MGFFSDLKKDALEDSGFVCLTQTSPLSELPDGEMKDALAVWYSHKDPIKRATASVLNAVYTGKKTAFVFTRDTLTSVMKKDVNLTTVPSMTNKGTLDGVKASLQNKGGMRKVRDRDNRRPEIYVVHNEEFLKMICDGLFKEVQAAQLLKCIEFVEQICPITGNKLKNQYGE